MNPSEDIPQDAADPGDAAYATELDEVAGAARADEAAAKAPGERLEHHDPEERQEQLLEEGLEETFPASDPVSVKRIT